MRKVFDDAIGLFNVRTTPPRLEASIFIFPDTSPAGLHDIHKPRCCSDSQRHGYGATTEKRYKQARRQNRYLLILSFHVFVLKILSFV